MPDFPPPLNTPSSHDYRSLVARWRAVAKACGLKLQPFAGSGEYPVYCLQTKDRGDGGLYVSATIHGDEPAGAAALIEWAEERLPSLVQSAGLPLLLLPCLNPWGLVNNRRTDEAGEDLNRAFGRDDLSPVAELKRLIGGRRFDLALHLHEDYDAQGTYLYELTANPASWGRDLLATCRTAIAPDPRRRIDKRTFKEGLFLRKALRGISDNPEALHLYPNLCPRVITFETPSEFSLDRRVRAQVLLLEACARRLLEGKQRPPHELPRPHPRQPTPALPRGKKPRPGRPR